MKPAHLHVIPPTPAPAVASGPLGIRAQRLWPGNDYMQTEWIRAVGVVRRTTNGWRLDDPMRRPT